MNNQEIMRVRHPKYGRGYVLLIGEDSFRVRFPFRGRKDFPLTAIDDGTLTASEETVSSFHTRLAALRERATLLRNTKA